MMNQKYFMGLIKLPLLRCSFCSIGPNDLLDRRPRSHGFNTMYFGTRTSKVCVKEGTEHVQCNISKGYSPKASRISWENLPYSLNDVSLLKNHIPYLRTKAYQQNNNSSLRMT